MKQVIALCLPHTRRFLELFQAYRAAYLFIVPFYGSILLQVKLHLKFLHLPLHFQPLPLPSLLDIDIIALSIQLSLHVALETAHASRLAKSYHYSSETNEADDD